MNGTFRRKDRLLASSIPTSREPTRPGPKVTEIPSISLNFSLPFSKTSFNTKGKSSRCFLAAISGTTPPYLM